MNWMNRRRTEKEVKKQVLIQQNLYETNCHRTDAEQDDSMSSQNAETEKQTF